MIEVLLGEKLSVACSIPLFDSKDRPLNVVVGSTSTMKLGVIDTIRSGEQRGKCSSLIYL